MYYCKNEKRRDAVLDNPNFNGIDYLEVDAGNQSILYVHFLKPVPGQPSGVPAAPLLDKPNFRIEGGVRVKNIVVNTVTVDSKQVLKLTTNFAGDFSTYILRLVTSAADETVPANFDPQLAAVEFSFKANCPSDFDCKTEPVCPEPQLNDPRIDYLAKDYASFRRLMLDRLSLLMPAWQERNAADLQIALVEMLAYTGDQLSYFQDAVATEAYLFKARQRTSVQRHARLLDYHMHNGCNARVWVQVAVDAGGVMDGVELKLKTRFLSKSNELALTVTPAELPRKLSDPQILVFESMEKLTLHAAHNQISFYTWHDLDCCLPAGATRATLYRKDKKPLFPEQIPVQKEPFPVLIFEEVANPETGSTNDFNPAKRHAVRLISITPSFDPIYTDVNGVSGITVYEVEWAEADALPFALCLSKQINDTEVLEISVVRGNNILCDHGLSIENADLIPASATAQGAYRPWIPSRDITVKSSYHPKLPAAECLIQSADKAIPDIQLEEDGDPWDAKRDLLASGRFSHDFVAEIASDGSVRLRFGDDVMGKKPGAGFQPKATYRVGNGSIGNVGYDAIGSIVHSSGGILGIRNPLPARGGVNPESMEEVRQFAPQAFRTQERAVTEADYVAKTELHPQVQKALAAFRWTGSWHTVFLTIDRRNDKPVDAEFKAEILRHLERYRLAAYDLEIRSPLFVPLEIELQVCVKPGYFSSNIKNALQIAFSRQISGNGTRGFFHPDAFTFGQPLYVSAIIERAMQIEGVGSVSLKTFKRMGRIAAQEINNGVLQPASDEIIRLDNDPNFPEKGKINFIMLGGL